MLYPWGSDAPVCQKGAPNGARFDDAGACDSGKEQTWGPDPVASHAPNGYGLFDMAGNVREWVSDWYGPYGSASASDPPGPASGTSRVMRGGSWSDIPILLHVSVRVNISPGSRDAFTGCRCARDVPR